jgi:hypothetical protein
MVNNAVLVPCVTLGAIAVCMFIFMCWWFPRTWARGQSADMKEQADNAEMRRQMQRDMESADADDSSIGGDGAGGRVELGAHQMRPPQVRYVPPPVTPF